MRNFFSLCFLKRLTAIIVLLAYGASCTHMPSGEKAFSSFESCFAANLGLAAAGGVGIGLLGEELAKKFTDNSGAAKRVGVAAGVAAASMIAMSAWKKCSVVYNTSTAVGKPAEFKPEAAAGRKAGLNLERMAVKVEGNENTAPTPEFEFSYFAENAGAKDIKARFRHKVEIVRFAADSNDKLVLADDKGNPLKDGSGNPIPLEQAGNMSRDKLHWATIAEDGRDDYVEDVIIQQGSKQVYRHKLQVPPRAQLPLPLPVPMRYALTVEVEGHKSKRNVDFSLLPTSQRPKTYSSSGASNSGEAPAPEVSKRNLPAEPAPAPASAPVFAATHITNKKTNVSNDNTGKGKVVASVNRGTKVKLLEKKTITVNQKAVEWARVTLDSGASGWLQTADLQDAK